MEDVLNKIEQKAARRTAVLGLGLVMCALMIIVGARLLRNSDAAELPLPTKVDEPDLSRLDAAMVRLQQKQMEAQPFVEKAQVIAAKYKFSLNDLGKTVSVNFDTGDIVRRQIQTEKK